MTEIATNSNTPHCALCASDGGTLVWRGPTFRVILAEEPGYPGFTRVIWNDHVAEMTDLVSADRDLLMRAVFLVEAEQRAHLRPDKINLASLGNMVPHVHWHVIPRWRDDPAFPDAVWAPSRRASQARANAPIPAYAAALRKALVAAFPA